MKYISADNNMTAEIFSSFVARLHIPIDKNEKLLYYIYKLYRILYFLDFSGNKCCYGGFAHICDKKNLIFMNERISCHEKDT